MEEDIKAVMRKQIGEDVVLLKQTTNTDVIRVMLSERDIGDEADPVRSRSSHNQRDKAADDEPPVSVLHRMDSGGSLEEIDRQVSMQSYCEQRIDDPMDTSTVTFLTLKLELVRQEEAAGSMAEAVSGRRGSYRSVEK